MNELKLYNKHLDRHRLNYDNHIEFDLQHLQNKNHTFKNEFIDYKIKNN